MNTFLVICLAVCGAFAEDELRAILKSPKATLKLYREFKEKQGQSFGVGENLMRLRLFVHNAEEVAAFNEQDESAKFELNFFSDLTASEKQSWLGLNITGHKNNAAPLSAAPAAPVPASTLWVSQGKVTAVKNQGSCGSCWTFGAVGGLETRYALTSNRLRNFAEQEYLDCVYEGQRDGCQGGWPSDCYSWSNDNGGRLSATADFPYKARDLNCVTDITADSMIAAKITGSVDVRATEKANVEALVHGSLAVAFEVTNKMQQYKRGILKDTTCHGNPNHAVTAVGYTKEYVLVKNSWGSAWGESGFIKFARGYHNCGLFKYSSYPTLKETSVKDVGDDDAATDYNPEGDVVPTDAEVCQDDSKRCRKRKCNRKGDAYKNKCKLTCGVCDCPPGTINCKGVCKHEHMCH